MSPIEIVEDRPPSANERKELKALVEGIVLSQGNIFIKELLRERGIPIGVTKDEFQRALDTAIDNGKLNIKHIEEWLSRVEGWGDQHVYLFRVPLATSQQALWERPDKVHDRVRKAGFSSRLMSVFHPIFLHSPFARCMPTTDEFHDQRGLKVP